MNTTINPTQDYDIIHTLTFSAASGNCPIRLHRGSSNTFAGTVYYRAGTSGAWTQLDVTGEETTFPITSTTMQVGHNWNKSGNDYMTSSFRGSSVTDISLSQKAVLSGVIGWYFWNLYAYGCTSLISLAVPDTSLVTSVGDGFTYMFAYGCTSLASLAIPDTSSMTSVGVSFMFRAAQNCNSLTKLLLPKAGWFKTHTIGWTVPAARLGLLKGEVLKYADMSDWKASTVSGTLYANQIQNANDITYAGSLTKTGKRIFVRR